MPAMPPIASVDDHLGAITELRVVLASGRAEVADLVGVTYAVVTR